METERLATGGNAPVASTPPGAGHLSPAWRRIAGLALQSAGRFPRLVASGALRRTPGRIGAVYRVDRGGDYAVFRETINTVSPAAAPVVLVVGFRLRAIRAVPALHWLFQRVCLLTTPFWSGFAGFRVKLWMVEPAGARYLGIYQWDGATNAQTYVDALVRVLRPLSTRDSVWYDLYERQDLDRFLNARRREASG